MRAQSLASQIANPNLVISRTCPPPNLQTCADAYVAAGTHPDRSTQSNKTRFQHQKAAHTNAARELVERLPASADRLRDPYFTAATSSRRRGTGGKRRAPPRPHRRHRRGATQNDLKHSARHGVHPRLGGRRLHFGSGRPQRRAVHHLLQKGRGQGDRAGQPQDHGEQRRDSASRGAFTPSTRLVSRNDGGGSFLVRF